MQTEKFLWYIPEEDGGSAEPAAEYQKLIRWAGSARGKNPEVFDELTEWIRSSGGWSSRELAENRALLMDRVIGRFAEQNRLLREKLTALEPSGVVNPAVFDALKRFDDELCGNTRAEELKEAVSRVFADFSAIQIPDVREKFAGNKTGPAGTDSVEIYGYINILKDCDAAVQWALFMPDFAKQQQQGFRLESFEYRKMPGLRFVGTGENVMSDPDAMKRLTDALNSMREYRCGFDDDTMLIHNQGRGVDVESCHVLFGRFLAADAPVPEGLEYVDFVPENDGKAGMPFMSQFAFATYTGDMDALHRREGYDSDAMYDVTRNIILGQNVPIPYPDKYWVGEVFLNGFEQPSTAYLFSVDQS